jgi:hypothetical protein
LYDGAAKRGPRRKSNPIIDVNRIKQATFQCISSFHRNVLDQLNRHWRFGRDFNGCSLANRGTAEQAEQKAGWHKALAPVALCLDPHRSLTMTISIRQLQ